MEFWNLISLHFHVWDVQHVLLHFLQGQWTLGMFHVRDWVQGKVLPFRWQQAFLLNTFPLDPMFHVRRYTEHAHANIRTVTKLRHCLVFPRPAWPVFPQETVAVFGQWNLLNENCQATKAPSLSASQRSLPPNDSSWECPWCLWWNIFRLIPPDKGYILI